MNVPYTRMNETIRMVQRMGGKITGVHISGDIDTNAPNAADPPKAGKKK